MKKFTDWFSDNWHIALFFVVAIVGVNNIYKSTAGHKKDVTLVSQQNAGCIYLESSRLGEGQHYMICDGQITLVRIGDPTQEPSEVSSEVVNEAVVAAEKK